MFIVINIVSHNFHACHIHRLYISSEYIEMSVKFRIWNQMHPGLNDCLAISLGLQAFLHCSQDFFICQFQFFNIKCIYV